MNKTSINISRTFVTHRYPTEVLYPGVGAFHDPALAVFPQLSSILMCGLGVIAAGWNNRLNTFFDQIRAHLVAIVTLVRNQLSGLASGNLDRLKCWQSQLHFRRGCRVHVNSERSTLAINQYHKLRSLAAFGFADFEAPFFALANVPSIKHSFQRICFFSCNWARKACHIFSNSPLATHLLKRLWTVLLAPYSFGKAAHCAPVHNIHNIPSKHLRSSTGGRPPRFRFSHGLLRTGNTSLTFSHCSSVNFISASSLGVPEAIIYLTSTVNDACLNYFRRPVSG